MNKTVMKIISVALTGMLMLSALAVTAMPSAAAESPVIPTAFYGNVTVNGAAAPVNTTVTGRIVSASGSPGNGSITTTVAGKYGGPEWYDTKLLVQTDSTYDIGKTIEFYVQLPSWGAAKQANETGTYDSASAGHKLDLTVNFTYNLTINSTTGGSVTTPGEGTFTCNASEVVALVAAAATNYSFVNWTGDVTTIADVNSATTNITMSGNYSITANFAAAALKYNLTINSTTGGSVTTPGEGTFTCNASEVVALVAAAATNYSFVNWTGDVTTIANVNSATTNITMSGNYSITANFAAAALKYNLTINSTTGGSVTTPGEGTLIYNASEVVALVATAATNYSFVNWTGNVTTIANVNSATTNITMNGNYSITANFAAVTYNLTITSTTGGSVTTPGEGTFIYNASEVVALVATAATNYSFVNWTGDVTTVANVNSATTNITMSGNYSITANFAASVTVATLKGNVTFTGRGSNNTKWAEPFNVWLFEPGNLSHVLWTGNATTSNTGVFNITGLTPGTYDIGIKNWTCLSVLNTSVTLTAGNTTVVDFGTILEGDANNDDHVNILDASSLAGAYGSSTGDPNWNPHCDFNREGNINILDASALAGNYGKHGDLA